MSNIKDKMTTGNILKTKIFYKCFQIHEKKNNTMFPDLQSVLRLEETPLKGKFIHICEEEDQLGAFLLHHFIHLGIKRNAKILLVGIENSFGHYNGIG